MSGDIAGAIGFVITGFVGMAVGLTTLIGWVQDFNPRPQSAFFVGVGLPAIGLLVLFNRVVRSVYGFIATKTNWVPQTKTITEEVCNLRDELAIVRTWKDQEAVESAYRKLDIRFSSLHVSFGVESVLKFQFAVKNYSLVRVEFTGNVRGQLASPLGGQNFGTGLVELSGIPENEERILNLN